MDRERGILTQFPGSSHDLSRFRAERVAMTTQNPLPRPEFPFQDADPATPTSPPQTDQPWQSMYTAERKKARVLGATTVAASLLAVGLGAWGLNAQGASPTSGPAQFGGPGATSQFGPPGLNGNSGQGAMPGPAGMDLGSQLLNSDGSVNTDAVEAFVQQLPSGALDQILAMAVQDGDLTQDQADVIAAAASGTDGQDT